MSLNSKYYTEDINKIQSVDFTILTNKDVKRYSAVSKDPFGINVPESYDNYEPKKGGLVDLRLGTCDPYLNCTTCGLNTNDCPGHFGHTELSEPVFHFGFLNNLKTVLQCICFKCTNIIIEKDSKTVDRIMRKKEKHRLKELREISKTSAYCYHCGTPVPTVTKEVKESTASVNIVLEREVGSVAIDEKTGETTDTKRKIKEILHPRKCYNILRNISDEDTYLLGFNPKVSRPEDFICIRFPIPPVIIRPTAKIDFLASSTMEDSLTLKIADIITWNTRIRNQNEKAMSGVDLTSFNENMQSLLQYHCATYFDNETLNLPKADFKASNKPIKSISERIKGKQGRVRANLMGKRVDFSARSVITSDPYIDIDEVGIPKRVAMDLTIPEEVTPFNIKKLSMLVKKGREVYPGANYVHRVNYIDGKLQPQRIDLKYRKKDIKLTYGDIVDRHIVNGDYVLFNRQPTLHKPSMMGHKIQVINAENTDAFRMNVSVTKPYNADFDGDEMNIHLAQSVQARNELERIANVKYNIIGARDSNPIIGCVQDTLTGAYILSQPNQKIDYHTACNILCGTTSETKYNLPKNKDLTGYELFSEIIPKGINVVSSKLLIKDGQIQKGTLNKASLSSQKNSIIHYIWDKYGADKTRKFIDDTQRLILEYLMYQGVTIGAKDIFLDDETTKKLFDQANTSILDAKHYITKMENDNNDISPEVIENAILSKMEPVGANTGSALMKHLNSDNNFFKMVDSKSKGNPQNIYQTMGVIGQLTLSKARPKKNIQNRSLPYFHRDDDTPEARGFVYNNLVKGLTGHEFFFNAGAGREGLIDTAIKTATTGYIQRRLVKALEDLSVKYDGTIRAANGQVIQYVYGENGINQLTQTDIKIDMVKYNNKEIEEKLSFNKKQISELETIYKKKVSVSNFNKEYINKMIKLRDQLRFINYKSLSNYKELKDQYMLPVNLYRITQDYSSESVKQTLSKQLYSENKEMLTPQYIQSKIDSITESESNKLIIFSNSKNKLLNKDEQDMKLILKIALHEYISPNRCIYEYGLTYESFNNMIKDIENSYIKSIVEPGEMVGVIAAQSLGEPTTQMSLDTKHSAGKAGVLSTALVGVPRIQEILSYSKSIKTPQTLIYFDKNIRSDRSAVNKINSFLKHLTIRELIDTAEIYYQINTNNSLDKKLKEDNVINPFFINNQKTELTNLPFIFRLKMNLEKMYDKETTLLDIKTKFMSYWYNNSQNTKSMKKLEKEIFTRINRLAILSSSESNKELILHIRFSLNSFDYGILSDFLTLVLDQISLKGMDNILGTNLIEDEKVIEYQDDGSFKMETEHMVVTEGINLSHVKKFKNIDFTRTICNDVHTTLKSYGIEAARTTLMKELINTFGSGGIDNINHNHLSVLVDFMSANGEVTSIDRHGLGKLDVDPLAKCSFEKTMDHLVQAAVFNESDKMKSVSSKIMIGQVIPGGTGAFGLVLDTEKLVNSEYTTDEANKYGEFKNIDSDPLMLDIMKFGINETNFFIPAY